MGGSQRLSAASGRGAGGRLVLQAAQQAPGTAPRRGKPAPLAVGSLVTGTVSRVRPLEAVLDLPEGRIGRLHVTEAAEPDAPPAANPLAALLPGQAVAAVVLARRRHKGRPLEGNVELSLRPSLLAAAEAGQAPAQPGRDPLASAAPGTLVTGYVTKKSGNALWLAVSLRTSGRASLLDASPDPARLAAIAAAAEPGHPFRARVLKAAGQRLELSLALRPLEGVRPSAEAAAAQPGDLLMGRVSKAAGTGVEIRLGGGITGIASLLELHDSWVDNALVGLKRGTFVRCCVLEAAGAEGGKAVRPARAKRRREGSDEDEDEKPEGPVLRVTLKASKQALVPGRRAAKKAEPAQPQEFALGSTVRGYVKSVGKQGAFVEVAPGTDARVKLSQLADTFLDAPSEAFPVGKLVRGRIVGNAHGRLEMSLRSEKRGDMEQLRQLREGQTVRGRVKRVEEYGAFVQLSEPEVVGLVHKSELADAFVKSAAGRLKPGQGVRAKVLAVDLERGRLSLGMKESYFVGDEEEDDEDVPPPGGDEAASESDLDEQLAAAAGSPEGASSSADESESEAEAEEGGDLDAALLDDAPASKRQRFSRAAAAAAVQEEAQASEEGSSGEDSAGDEPASSPAAGGLLQGGVGWGGEEASPPPATEAAEPAPDTRSEAAARRRAKREKAAREAAIAAAEAARLEGAAPRSAADFERELLGSPGSSYLWIRYMAFLVSLGEVAKARAVAERALTAIPYREEGEKLNVWVARLNLEARYGEPPEEAVSAAFQAGLQATDPKKLHLALIGILERTDQAALLAQTFKAATRRFPGSAKVWLRQLAHLQARGDGEGAARLLERAVDAVPPRKHVKLLRQAALQEFRVGSAERGRSVFEQLLRDHPKRLDLWSVYLDQEIKQNDPARIRALFDRATSVVMPAKKIKFLFKRYLDYEQKHGTPATVDGVKRAARDYLQRVL